MFSTEHLFPCVYLYRFLELHAISVIFRHLFLPFFELKIIKLATSRPRLSLVATLL